MRTQIRSLKSAALCIILFILLATPCINAHEIWDGFSSFFAEDTVPPELVYPENGARFSAGDEIVYFIFSEIEGAIQYEVEFSLSSIFSEEYILTTDAPAFHLSDFMTQSQWDQLSFQLFWRVRAIMEDNEITQWSAAWEFAKTVAGSPDLLSPGPDSRFCAGGEMPLLKWSPLESAESYAIEFAQDEEFQDSYGWFSYPFTVLDFGESGDRSQWDPINGTFYWRVWVLEANGVPGPKSQISYFSKTTIGAPSLTNPPDNSKFASSADIPILQWESVADVSEYQLQLVYDEAPFSDGEGYFTVIDHNFDFSEYGVTPEIWRQFYGNLNWRIAGVDPEGNHGCFSHAFEFTKITDQRYMSYGDSVTGGFGSSTWGTGFAGYPPILQSKLKQRYGNAVEVCCQQGKSWFPGGHAYTGDWNFEKAIKHHGVSVVLIMFGVVDAIDDGAPGCNDHDCQVKLHLANMVSQTRAFHAIPFLATLPPINPESDRVQVQPSIDEFNADIRDLSGEMSVPLADLDSAFRNAPLPLSSYFYINPDGIPDWAHFNDAGYELIANVWNNLL